MNIKNFFLVGLVTLLVACGVPAVSTSPPTPEAILVSYPAALQSWTDQFSACSIDEPQAAIYLTPYIELSTSVASNEVILSLGDPSYQLQSSYLSKIGSEQVLVIVNQENNLIRLSTSDLRSIFTGETSKWEHNDAKSIQVWTYPGGDALRTIFEGIIQTTRPITTNAMLAPDPEAMLDAIGRDLGAIGYLPQSILTTGDPGLTGKVKSVQLENKLMAELNLPLVATTKNEPVGMMREFLICLQSIGLK